MKTGKSFTIASLASVAQAWTSTAYWGTRDKTGGVAVPTGPVTATSTQIQYETRTVEQWQKSNLDGFINITRTGLYLGPGEPWCFGHDSAGCSLPTTAVAPATIDTTYYVPLTVSNPTSCSSTSFAYITPKVLSLSFALPSESQLLAQATDSSVAAFVTTYASTVSTNLGGQAVVRTICNIYLRDDAIVNLTAKAEPYYLNLCIDPRRYLQCSGTAASDGACPIQDNGPYPPTSPSPTSGGGRHLTTVGSCWLALAVLFCVVLVLC